MKNFIFCSRKCLALTSTLLLALVLSINVYSQSTSIFGDFPFQNSFLSTAQPSYITVASNPNTVQFTMDGIQLTKNQTNQFGGVFFNDRKFSSANGIIVEFEYMMYGGGANGGDGMSLFLFDADASANPTIGAAGAALGYNYNSGTDGTRKGLTGAYLGVALDAYGNHKQLRFEGVSNQAGIPFAGTTHGASVENPVEAAYNQNDNIVLRGAKNGPLEAWREITQETRKLEEGYTGYPVLISQSTSGGRGVIKKDDKTGDYIPLTPAYNGNRFKISGNGTFSSSDDVNYRKAIVELFPAKVEDGGGFYVTVSIKHNTGTDVIIEDYHYKEKFYYKENIMLYSKYSGAIDKVQPSFELNAKVPDWLRIGFAASTGAATNINVVKNVHIMLPRAAEAYNDSTTINPVQTAELSPFINDIAYEGIIRRDQTGSSANINPDSFRFMDNGTIISVNPGDTFIERTVAGQGTWKYYPATNKVTFTPVAGFKGTASIKYNIKGKKDNTPQAGPYDDEAYRSLYADLIVNVDENYQPPKTTMITNRMVTNRLFN